MFDGVVIAPARLLGKQRQANPINEQGSLPLGDRNIVLTDKFTDIGKKSTVGARHIHDNSIIVNFNHSNRLRDVVNQRAREVTDKYNFVALPFTEPLPTLEGSVIE